VKAAEAKAKSLGKDASEEDRKAAGKAVMEAQRRPPSSRLTPPSSPYYKALEEARAKGKGKGKGDKGGKKPESQVILGSLARSRPRFAGVFCLV
jgi:hypothetical protein